MNKLSARQLKILKKIISADKLDIEDICNIFNISKRTVYREVSAINAFLEEYELKTVNTLNGITIEGNGENVEKLKLDIVGYRSGIDAEERRKLILSELLQMKEPVKLEYFSRKFDVSTATISYDLKELEKWLKKQGLMLIAKPGYGVLISGGENQFRKAIANFLYENVDTAELIDFLKTGYLKRNRLDRDIDLRLLNLIDYDTVLKIERAIAKLEAELDYDIAESSYLGLTVHLALAVKRLKDGESIKISDDNLKELKNTGEYKFAKKLARYLEEELGIIIPEDELGYVTIHLIGAKYRANTQNINYNDISDIAIDMVNRAEKIFNVDFSGDELLVEGLKAHLGPTVYRLKMGLDIRNPLLNDIKSKYETLFNKCDKLCDVLREKLNLDVPEDEIGYIAMHFGAALERMKDVAKKYNIMVVCASGIGTSRMLMSKLQMFPQINIVDVVSSLKLKDIKDRKDIDLIVSTIPLEVKDRKVIVVNPLLLKEDIDKLKRALNTDFIMDYGGKSSEVGDYQAMLHIANYGKHILNLSDNLLFKDVFGKNSKEIIEHLLNVLSKEKLIDESQSAEIKKRLLGRESLGKIILPDKGFVIYHCTLENLKRPIVIIGRVVEEIKMKNLLGEYEKIKTAFLMVAPQNDSESIEVLGDLSVSLIEHNNLVDSLNNAKCTEEVRQKVKEALMKKFFEEIKRTVI